MTSKRKLRGQADAPTGAVPANTLYFVVETKVDNSRGGRWEQLPHTTNANFMTVSDRANYYRDKFKSVAGYRVAMVPRTLGL